MACDGGTHPQQYPIEARLNALLGASAYDSAFAGFRLGDIVRNVAFVWTPDEASAAIIEARYRDVLLAVLREKLNEPIRYVTALPSRFPSYA